MSESNLDEKLLPLLLTLLRRVRDARRVPLQFGIDSGVIASAVSKEFLVPGHDPTAMLDELVGRVLQPEGSRRHEEAPINSEVRSPKSEVEMSLVAPPGPRKRDASNTEATPSDSLAPWLDQFHAAMTEVQPRAVEIVALRVEGFEDRDIAERLGLGLRVVKRIVEDVRVNWERAARKE